MIQRVNPEFSLLYSSHSDTNLPQLFANNVPPKDTGKTPGARKQRTENRNCAANLRELMDEIIGTLALYALSPPQNVAETVTKRVRIAQLIQKTIQLKNVCAAYLDKNPIPELNDLSEQLLGELAKFSSIQPAKNSNSTVSKPVSKPTGSLNLGPMQNHGNSPRPLQTQNNRPQSEPSPLQTFFEFTLLLLGQALNSLPKN